MEEIEKYKIRKRPNQKGIKIYKENWDWILEKAFLEKRYAYEIINDMIKKEREQSNNIISEEK